jgi:chromosome segregation protein
MAPEEFAEAKERYDFLSGQLADMEKARDDLARITAEIRAESSELFLATYNRIKKNFHTMFRRLFGGGRAELRLSDPNHVLESGIEIYAQPPGKKLENITLLSGGEKSMTAVGLLFATYMVKPSPFCLLDEIDAALDEANVLRFVQLLREFGSTSQFIVITHNKKTVTGAQTLLGVTMEESGITKVISVRLEGEEGAAPEPIAESEPYEEEEVEAEEGMELPLGVDDPSLVDQATLHPIRARRNAPQE